MKLGVSTIFDINERDLKKLYLLLDHMHLDGYDELVNAISGKMESGISGLGIGLSLAYKKAVHDNNFKNDFFGAFPNIEYLAEMGFLKSFKYEVNNNIPQGKGFELSNKVLGFDPSELYKKYDYEKLKILQHFSARIKSNTFSKNEKKYDIVPFLGNPISNNHNNKKTKVFNLVLKNFPLIDTDIPWKNLVDFKKEFKLDYLAIRNWINNTSNESINLNEIQEKLEYDLESLRKRYKHFNLKYSSNSIKINIISTSKILEDLAKLKFSSALEKILNVGESKIALLDQELNIPNKELSYIIKAENHFRH